MIQSYRTHFMKLCVVVPVYNEQAVLPEFLRRVGVSLQQLEMGPHQLLFVDDGSTDATLEILRDAAAHDPRVAVLSLSRNFGHQAAITAALDHVHADATVIMDADLQDPPEKIAEFIQKWKEGYDVVYARRIKRKESWWFRLSYFVFYRLLSALSNVELPIDAGDFGLMSARVVEEVRKMPEHLRFTRGLRAWVGFRQTALPIERSERQAGDSKYTPLRLFRLAADGIFAFSSAPLHVASVLGLIAVCLSSAFAIYSILAKWLFHHSPQGFTALTVLITFVSGVNLMFLGVIGAYVGRIYEEVKARPVYIIDKKLGALFER